MIIKGILIWKFCRDLLKNPNTNPSVLYWISKDNLTFKINDGHKMAKLWGRKKNNSKMNYDKLARAIRYLLKFKVLNAIDSLLIYIIKFIDFQEKMVFLPNLIVNMVLILYTNLAIML